MKATMLIKHRIALMLLLSTSFAFWYFLSVLQPEPRQPTAKNDGYHLKIYPNLSYNQNHSTSILAGDKAYYKRTRNYHTIVQNLVKNYHVIETRLANLTNFRRMIDCNVCEGESDVFMLVLVGSHAAHRSQRDVLRSTLARPGIGQLVFKMVFTFGLLEDLFSQRGLEEESQQHRDIVQGNFIDSYQNVTLRDLMAFRWAWQRCPQAKYVMRLDDDTSVNVFKLADVLNSCCAYKPVFIGCFDIWHDAPVYRDGRYGLTFQEHPQNTFEDYCFGWMYVTTPLMAYLLDWASNYVRYYWLNDAFICGSLVQWLGIKHLRLPLEYTFDANEMKLMLENKTDKKYVVGPNNCDANFTKAIFLNFKYGVYNLTAAINETATVAIDDFHLNETFNDVRDV